MKAVGTPWGGNRPNTRSAAAAGVIPTPTAGSFCILSTWFRSAQFRPIVGTEYPTCSSSSSLISPGPTARGAGDCGTRE